MRIESKCRSSPSVSVEEIKDDRLINMQYVHTRTRTRELGMRAAGPSHTHRSVVIVPVKDPSEGSTYQIKTTSEIFASLTSLPHIASLDQFPVLTKEVKQKASDAAIFALFFFETTQSSPIRPPLATPSIG